MDKDSIIGKLSGGVSLAAAILFSFHVLLSTPAAFAGILNGVQKRLGRRVDFPSFGRRNSSLYRVEEFRKTDPDPLVNLFPPGSQPKVQGPGIMISPFLHDQTPPDKRAYHPGGRAFFHCEDVMEFRQLDFSLPGNAVENEELGESQVEAERLFLLAAAQGPRQLSDEGKDFPVGYGEGQVHGCILQLSPRKVKNFFLL